MIKGTGVFPVLFLQHISESIVGFVVPFQG